MNEDFDKFEEDISFLNKAKYLFLVVVMSIAYFFYAIFVGIYEWIMSRFKDDP